jgi:hypothetical protein
MTTINNVFTDLFDALIDSTYDGLIIYSGSLPCFWKARYKGPVPGFDMIDIAGFEADLEALGIIDPAKGEETYKLFKKPKDEKPFTFYDHIRDDASVVRLRIKYVQWGNAIRLTVYRPGIAIP